MSPASARALRRRRVAELRAAEPHLSLRQMADRLGISRDTVTRDLAEIDRDAAESAPPADQTEPVAEGSSAAGSATGAEAADSAPQVSGGGRTDQPPVAEVVRQPAAPVADRVAGHLAVMVGHRPEAADRPPAALPRRVAEPLADADLSRWPAVRRDLAVLAQTERSPEALAHQAITALAHHYSRALARGDIQPGQPFVVTDMTLRPLPVPAPRGS
ncbi:HTH domain-containing protein [Streptomyces sp. NTH33]|uniref:HTH domain-containing protein n=1 Tax=Streptomyces sp. NTH33 TaxID=1735453 RepID=UPI0015E88909|nr:HTH domain-containing protein [Streptomyces sp. NTH33]